MLVSARPISIRAAIEAGSRARAAAPPHPRAVGLDAFERRPSPADRARAIGSVAAVGDKPAYQLFGDGGATKTYGDLVDAAKQADVVLFGELHDNPIGHWLERELAADPAQPGNRELVLGAEMFEADNQVLLSEYLHGLISESAFKQDARLWPNYATDYRPLVELAKDRGLSFMASDVPRRYANMVAHGGLEALDALPAEVKRWIAPLPIAFDPTLKCYRDIIEGAGGHGGENMAKAQALKDATMAHFILQGWREGQTLLHFNGAYHSNNREGIAWYLKRERPDLKILVVSSTIQKSVDELDPDSRGLGDFVLVTPESMTPTS